ncbi:MAG: mechanosensitive ion channel family protein [Erythrobacter sp.]|jgi:small-conductance mechanosensitive channel
MTARTSAPATDGPDNASGAIVSGADTVREDIAQRSEAFGDVVNRLDSLAIAVGDWRISAFDVLFAVSALALVLALAWLATRLTRSALRRITALDGVQRLLVEKIATIVIWVVTFLVGVDLLGVDLTALTVFSGAFGLAVGFGLQKTLGNLIAGIILLMDKSIKPGDVIEVADQAGNEAIGQIRKIGIRAISVITRDQTEYLIPNENLMVNQVINWSYSSKNVRVKAPVGVAYHSDLKLVTDLLYRAVEETPRVLTEPKPRVNLMGFGDSSVDFELRFWIADPEAGIANIRSDVFMRIWELFREHGVDIPFPQRDLNLRESKQMQALIAALERKDNPANDVPQ